MDLNSKSSFPKDSIHNSSLLIFFISTLITKRPKQYLVKSFIYVDCMELSENHQDLVLIEAQPIMTLVEQQQRKRLIVASDMCTFLISHLCCGKILDTFSVSRSCCVKLRDIVFIIKLSGSSTDLFIFLLQRVQVLTKNVT